MGVYKIEYDSGYTTRVTAPNMECAKKYASQNLKHHQQGVSLIDTASGEEWRRDHWRNLNRFGWTKWELKKGKRDETAETT